jgi:hypothetical protein
MKVESEDVRGPASLDYSFEIASLRTLQVRCQDILIQLSLVEGNSAF